MSGKAEKKAEAAPAEGAPKKSKKKLFIIIGAVVLLAAGGGGAAFVMKGKHDKKEQTAKADKHGGKGSEHEEEGDEEQHEEDDKSKKKPPVFYTMEPFVVNLAGDSQHYLQVGVDLKLSKDEYIEKIKVVLPEIRNGVVLLLSNKQAADLATLEGKNHLRAEIRAAANKPIGVKDHVRRKPDDEQDGAHKSHEDEGEEPGPKKGVVDVLLTSFVIQ